MSRIVDARGVAARLGVTPATVLAWARRGWVPCLRAGRRPVLFDVGEVERALGERGRLDDASQADTPDKTAERLRMILDLARRLGLSLANGHDGSQASSKWGCRD